MLAYSGECGAASYALHVGDCLGVLAELPAASVDAVITDPPYPCINRSYGVLDVPAWWDLMMGVCDQVRRILKPAGSAVFILQPNSATVGSMRGWLWDFMGWVCREWNMPQDVYWFSDNSIPTVHCQRGYGLMRPSVKTCVWAGAPDCYRNQDAVLLPLAESTINGRINDFELKVSPSGHHRLPGRALHTAIDRGGSTPRNFLRFSNSNSTTSSARYGHGAGTPAGLADWWARYILPPGGVMLDPFCGAGTMGAVALSRGASFIGIDQHAAYIDATYSRLTNVQPPLFLSEGGEICA